MNEPNKGGLYFLLTSREESVLIGILVDKIPFKIERNSSQKICAELIKEIVQK